MARGGNSHVGRKHHVIADDNVGIINQRQVEVGVKIIADSGVSSVGNINRRFYPARFTDAGKHASNNIVS